MLTHSQPPELHVPDGALTKPAGAVVDANGFVTCVTCGTQLHESKADIVGQGYRCATCGLKAHVAKLQGRGDAAAHLDQGEREGMRAAGMQSIGLGALSVLGGVVLLAFFANTRIGFKLGIVLCVLGLGMIAVGFQRRSAAKD